MLLPPVPYVNIMAPQDTFPPYVPEQATVRINLPSPVFPAYEPFGVPTVANPMTTR